MNSETQKSTTQQQILGTGTNHQKTTLDFLPEETIIPTVNFTTTEPDTTHQDSEYSSQETQST